MSFTLGVPGQRKGDSPYLECHEGEKKGDSLYLGYSGDEERVIFYTSGVPRTKKG